MVEDLIHIPQGAPSLQRTLFVPRDQNCWLTRELKYGSEMATMCAERMAEENELGEILWANPLRQVKEA